MEKEVYDYLIANHIGKDNLIKNKELRMLFNVGSDKSLGSVSGKSGGFYICDNEEEIQETIDNIKHRANQMLRMCHILEWKKGLEK